MRNIFYFIYKLTSPSGKVYIGQSMDLKSRFSNYRSLTQNRQPKLYNSIKKYGWESFKIEILFNGLCTKEEIDSLEELHIKTYWDLGISLNGSLHAHGLPHEKGRIEKSKEVYQYNKKGEFIRKWDYPLQICLKTNLDGRLISQVCNKKTHLAYNYFWFYEEDVNKDYINLSIKAKEKKKVKIPKRVVQLNINGEFIKLFESASVASKELNINNSAIAGVLSGKLSTSGGFRWVRESEWNNGNFKLRPLKFPRKPIIFIDINNNIEKEFISVTEAAKELNLNKTSIFKYLKKKTKSKKNYEFKYKN